MSYPYVYADPSHIDRTPKMKKYCPLCGLKLIAYSQARYSPYTGEIDHYVVQHQCPDYYAYITDNDGPPIPVENKHFHSIFTVVPEEIEPYLAIAPPPKKKTVLDQAWFQFILAFIVMAALFAIGVYFK